jgi:hypothetical protein
VERVHEIAIWRVIDWAAEPFRLVANQMAEAPTSTVFATNNTSSHIFPEHLMQLSRDCEYQHNDQHEELDRSSKYPGT